MSGLIAQTPVCEIADYLATVTDGLCACATGPVGDHEQALVAADRVARTLAGLQARWLADAEKTGVVRRSGARNPAKWLEDVTGESSRDAHAKRAVADAISVRPSLGEGLLDGSLNAAQVEQIQRAADTTEASDAQIDRLTEDAKDLSVKDTGRLIRDLERELCSETPEERFDQQRRKRSASIGPKGDGSGMIELRALFHPIAGARICIELIAAAKKLHAGEDEERSYRQIMADALEDLITSSDLTTSTGSSAAASSTGVGVIVTVSLDDLIAGINKTGNIAGTAETIPVEQIRRIACELGIYPAVLGARGEVLDLGRRVRLASSAQKRALKATYGGCGVDGCDSCFDFCDIHHIWEWLNGGPTDLANLVPLCSHHHHLVHDQGWTIVRSSDGIIILKPP
ncbi:MAG: HNH endonuclease [Acidimicrobiales bacterium]